MRELFKELSARTVIAVAPDKYKAKIPENEQDQYLEPLSGEAEAVSGHICIIEYRGSGGEESVRQISCIRIDVGMDSTRYIYAWCHERKGRRTFRVDRILQVFDNTTGEALGVGQNYFERFVAGRELKAGLNWGLSVRNRADLIAGLNVLIFLSRCDGHAHPTELEEIERFATGWWIRNDIAHDMPETEIMHHVNRMAPDAEAFVIALDRAAQDAANRRQLRGYAERTILADNYLDPRENHWMQLVLDQLN